MSSGVSVRAARGRRLVGDTAGVAAWLAMVAEAHGLQLEGGDTQWLLAGEELSVEVVLDSGRRGLRGVELVPQLFFSDEAQERSVKRAWREILGEVHAYASSLGGTLRSHDADRRVQVADLDAVAGLNSIGQHSEPASQAEDPRWAWLAVAARPTAPEPMPAALIATDDASGLRCDEAAVRAWLDAREERKRQLVSERADGGWRVAATPMTVDVVPIREGGLLIRLELLGTVTYRDVEEELAARRLFRLFLDDLAEFGQDVGGMVAVGDPLRVPDDDGLYEFVGMTRIARRRFILPDNVTAKVDYAALSAQQAQDLMDQWLADGPARLAWLADQTGEEVDLDRSPESLVALWRWARPRLRWREQTDGFDADRVPIWVDPRDGHALDQFSDHTLWLIDAIGRYWAAVWCEETGDRWVLHRSRIRGDVNRNRPVLERWGGNPLVPTATNAWRSLRHDPRASDDQLRTTYDVVLESMRKHRHKPTRRSTS